MINLKQFCGDEPTRYYLSAPFSFGKFTYATNAHIMVRVGRRDDVPETDKPEIKWDAPFAGLAEAKFSPLLHKELPTIPPPTEEACDHCYEGHVHDCPSCECECGICDGSGIEKCEARISTTIRGGIFNLRYVLMMVALPGVEVMSNRGEPRGTVFVNGELPLLFKFDGGFGAIMPMRAKDSEHIEIEADKAA